MSYPLNPGGLPCHAGSGAGGSVSPSSGIGQGKTIILTFFARASALSRSDQTESTALQQWTT